MNPNPESPRDSVVREKWLPAYWRAIGEDPATYKDAPLALLLELDQNIAYVNAYGPQAHKLDTNARLLRRAIATSNTLFLCQDLSNLYERQRRALTDWNETELQTEHSYRVKDYRLVDHPNLLNAANNLQKAIRNTNTMQEVSRGVFLSESVRGVVALFATTLITDKLMYTHHMPSTLLLGTYNKFCQRWGLEK
jgi:hypothetical protein